LIVGDWCLRGIRKIKVAKIGRRRMALKKKRDKGKDLGKRLKEKIFFEGLIV
jgi:hypothetical protein